MSDAKNILMKESDLIEDFLGTNFHYCLSKFDEFFEFGRILNVQESSQQLTF